MAFDMPVETYKLLKKYDVPDRVIAEKNFISIVTLVNWKNRNGLTGKRIYKISENDIKRVKTLHAAGKAQGEIAEIFGISTKYVSNIVNGHRRVKKSLSDS